VREITKVGTFTEHSCLPLITSLADLHLSCKYTWASPREIWYINTASLDAVNEHGRTLKAVFHCYCYTVTTSLSCSSSIIPPHSGFTANFSHHTATWHHR